MNTAAATADEIAVATARARRAGSSADQQRRLTVGTQAPVAREAGRKGTAPLALTAMVWVTGKKDREWPYHPHLLLFLSSDGSTMRAFTRQSWFFYSAVLAVLALQSVGEDCITLTISERRHGSTTVSNGHAL